MSSVVGKRFETLIAPKDQDGFIQSFPPNAVDGYLEFYNKFGFVIIQDVVPLEHCKQCIKDIWELIEKVRPGIQRDDPGSWEYWLGYASGGLLSQALSVQAWENRVNQVLYEAFCNIMKQKDLWVSVDNWGLLRPTKNIPKEKLDPDVYRTTVKAKDPTTPVEDKPDWATKSRWLHWDLNPFYWTSTRSIGLEYEFLGDFISENNGSKNTGAPKLQGLVNLVDAREEDGGFLIVPGFQKYIKEWSQQEHLIDYQKENCETYDFVYVPDNDPLQEQTQKIPMRAGSLLIWSSEMPHCNYPNSSSNFRMVQYIKMFPAQKDKTGIGFRKKLLREHVPQHIQQNPLHRKILGIDDY